MWSFFYVNCTHKRDPIKLFLKKKTSSFHLYVMHKTYMLVNIQMNEFTITLLEWLMDKI